MEKKYVNSRFFFFKFLHKYIYLKKFWLAMEKLWYYGKNYGTIEKNVILYRKLFNFD